MFLGVSNVSFTCSDVLIVTLHVISNRVDNCVFHSLISLNGFFALSHCIKPIKPIVNERATRWEWRSHIFTHLPSLKQDVFKLQTMHSRKAFPRHYLYWSHIEDSCVGIWSLRILPYGYLHRQSTRKGIFHTTRLLLDFTMRAIMQHSLWHPSNTRDRWPGCIPMCAAHLCGLSCTLDCLYCRTEHQYSPYCTTLYYTVLYWSTN